ncbi:MAG: hypothetical protein F4X75_25090 [Gemmatimonadetes bacterium]|nr:hypothetical protein [Gemmatimonadota bacterium]
MLLVDEVILLERILPEIKDIGLSTPMIGDGTDERINFIHNFMSAILIARRVFEKIDKCDSRRRMFKDIREKFRYEDYVELEIDKSVCVMEFLGMIIHSSYIFKGDKFIQVMNDNGRVFRVSTQAFLDMLDSLCIGKNGAVWVMCKLFKKFVKNIEDRMKKEFSNELEDLLNNDVNINEEVFYERLKKAHMNMTDAVLCEDNFLNWLSFYCNDNGIRKEPDMELAREILLNIFSDSETKHRIEMGYFRNCVFMPKFKNMSCEITVSSSNVTESGEMEFLSKQVPVGKLLYVIENYHANRYHKEIHKK